MVRWVSLEWIVEFPIRCGWPKEWKESWYLNRRVGDAKDRIDVIHKVSYS